MATRKVTLTRWYADDTSTVEVCPSRAAAERILEGYYADAVLPYIRKSLIVKVEANVECKHTVIGIPRETWGEEAK